MRRIFTTLGIAAVLSLSAAPTAFAVPGDQVCADLGSGKIDTTGDPMTVTLKAPAGMVITEYCVKAGSAKQGDGPKYYPVNPPVASLTIDYPGKAISHYSFTYVPVEAPEEPETPTQPDEPGAPGAPGAPAPEIPAPVVPAPEIPAQGPGAPAPEAPAQGPGAPAPAPEAPAQGPEAPAPAPEAPAQGPGAPAPASEAPTRALGAPASGAPAQGPAAPAAPAQAVRSVQQIADERAVTNQGLNVQTAGIDASPAQSPVVLGGILALLVTAGIWTLRKSLAKQ